MIKALPLAVILTSCHYFLFGQSSSTLIGARASGIGYTSSCLGDEWSVFNNIGGLASVNSPVVAFAGDVQPSFAPFSRVAVVAAVPLKTGVTGLGMFRFGDDLYNEQIVSAGYASTFGLASLGLKINYIQYNVTGFGRKGLFTVSLGGIAALTTRLSIGAHIINVNQPALAPEFDERLPTILIAGLLFRPSANTLITTELEKDLDFGLTWKAGIEYQAYKKFAFRTGFNLYPASGFLGFGMKSTHVVLDYTFQYRPLPGSRHQAGIGYKFGKREKK